MRALLCPASLKGVLSARRAAAALARGVRAGGADATELPVADGGEGTAEVVRGALGGAWREASVRDPLGRPHTARWLVLPDGRALVEASAAIGLPLLSTLILPILLGLAAQAVAPRLAARLVPIGSKVATVALVVVFVSIFGANAHELVRILKTGAVIAGVLALVLFRSAATRALDARTLLRSGG